MPRATSLGMPEDVDPEDLFVTDDAYVAGRRAFTEGMSVLENPMAHTGDWGKALVFRLAGRAGRYGDRA